MKFSYNWLQSFFKRKLPNPEKLAELLTLHFAEVEEVSKVRSHKSKVDYILDIDVRPNRACDCFSHLGVAGEIAAIINSKIPLNQLRVLVKKEKNLKAKDFIKVDVKDKENCPRYTVRAVCDVKIGPSPKWIREKLEACGLRPINNIVDIANYTMLETGQPLHAFDGEKIEGRKIIVRFAKKGEKITTLDEEKYDLDKNVLVIADAKKPIAVAGIKGGLGAEIDEKTKNIVLESANFNPKAIRRGSKRIDLKTDASWRFEHGIDPNLTALAINRAAYLIQEIAYGKVCQGLIDVYSKKTLPKKIKLDLDYVEKILGMKIPQKEIIRIFKSLGFKIIQRLKSKNASREGGGWAGVQYLIVEAPTRRLDISAPEDLIEEIGRIYGYQKIPAAFPIAALVPPERNLNIFWEDMVKDILKGAGFSEVYNYSFLSEKGAEIFKYGSQDLIEIENPISSDFQYLRPSLLPNLLKNIERNQPNFEEIKIFELGKIFQQAPHQKLRFGAGQARSEEKALTGIMTGDRFYEAKGIVDLLLQMLGISSVWYDEYRTKTQEKEIPWWHLKNCAEIKVDHERIGFLGEVSLRILNEYKIVSKIIYFDIDFEKLSKLASEEHEFRPISRFPAAIRDIAVLVPRETRIEEVLNKIERAGGEIIRDIDLFDIYEGEELPTDKKNLAFRIIYQAEDRALTSKEIDEIQHRIIKALEEEEGWEVRK